MIVATSHVIKPILIVGFGILLGNYQIIQHAVFVKSQLLSKLRVFYSAIITALLVILAICVPMRGLLMSRFNVDKKIL